MDKTCIFFNFPYLAMASSNPTNPFTKRDNEHPARTLLQSHYRLNNTTDRDRFQCLRLLKGDKLRSCLTTPDQDDKNSLVGKETQQLLYVPQFWGVIVGLGTLLSVKRTQPSAMLS